MRTVNITNAGYQYYTYKTESKDNQVCTAVSASGSESLYATFNVVYEEGTISAKAYDENDNLITDAMGNSEVSTPGTASKLDIQVDKTEIDADGSSLAYISVDVKDAQGNFDTTAVNTINFKLSGNGEIVGVDNGNQATTEKYQQSSVLTDTTTAKIAAYAGKALVIVRSTKEAGSFIVDVSAENMTGGSATVKTKKVDDGEAKEGLTSYTMVRDYTIKAGTKPAFQTSASGVMADKTEVTGTVTWEEISQEMYQTPGDYVVKGSLQFADMEPLNVTCRLHVIGNIVALRNVSTATSEGVLPTLPGKVSGVLADGTLSGEFAVEWDSVTAEQFTPVGSLVQVQGKAKIFGNEELPVTVSVRVAEAVNTESTNVAPSAAGLTQDIEEGKQSDNLNSIKNGITKPGDNTSERWSNWGNRTTAETAALTFRWDTAQLLSSVNLYYYFDSCAALPEDVSFEYSLDGQTFTPIENTGEKVEEYGLGAKYIYTFANRINPVALKIILKQQGGTSGSHCVALTEAEIMTYAGKIQQNSSAVLSGISVDGKAFSDFAADKYAYKAEGTKVTVETELNAGITILPIYESIVRILTVSEDGSETFAYTVELTEVQKEKPKVTLSAKATDDGKIALTGKFEDYGNIEKYYEVTGHGFVYYSSTKLGSRNLTVNTPGRTKVNMKTYKEDGSYTYNMKPAYSSTKYTVRAYMTYKDAEGKTIYVYSEPKRVSYNGLK